MTTIVSHELLADLALLSAVSVLVHYFFGLAGVAAAVLCVSLLEHGADFATALLNRGARCVALRGELADKAADAIAAIRARRATKTAFHGTASGGFFAALRAADHERLIRAAHCTEHGVDTADPRALLEHFADDAAAPDTAYNVDVQRERGDVASEASAASSDDDAAARLVICNLSGEHSSRSSSSSAATTDASAPLVPSHQEAPSSRHDSFIPMNARAPVAFETDLFAGHVHFFVRTTPEDPHWAHLFHGRRRMFWIQVQGVFKRAPRGTVYLGGELPAQIAPGVFTRSIALVIMGIIQQLVGSVNFSFGDARCGVMPSIALPLYQSADQLVVTPAGESPPCMGERDFGESDAARRLRRATPIGAESYVVGATYSFDFHTMYVDLAHWRTANLPGLREMDLCAFFGALPLRMVAYDICATPAERHCQQHKQYLFKFEVQYAENGAAAAAQAATAASSSQQPLLERTESDHSEETTVSVAGVASSSAGGMSTVVSDASSFDGETLDDALFFQHERARRLATLSLTYACWLEEVDVATGVRRVHLVFALRDASVESPAQQLAVVSAYALRTLLLGQLKRRCKRRLPQQQQRHHSHIRAATGAFLTRSSSSSNIADDDHDDVLAPLTALRFHSQSRIGSYSSISDETRVVAECLDALLREQQASTLNADADADGDADTDTDAEDVAFQARLFECLTQRTQLASAACSPSKLGVNWSQRERADLRVVCDGVVLRYYTHTLLRQEVLLVTADELLFFRSYASSAEKRVACSCVLRVRALPTLPLACGVASNKDVGDSNSDIGELDPAAATAGAFALQISTLAEEIVLCVGSEHARSAWLRALSERCAPPSPPQPPVAGVETAGSSAAQLLHICGSVSKPLKPAGRIVLNARSLFPLRLGSSSSEDDAGADADIDAANASLTAVTRALELALRIHDRGGARVSVTETLAFLDAASDLRALDLRAAQRALRHEALMALYLNLYHVVLAHAMLVHGFPRGRSQWAFFATHMCYSVGLDGRGEQLALSLAEIEHVLLRKRMAPADVPYLSVSTLLGERTGATPVQQQRQRQLAGLGVAHPDFRVIFALAMHQQPPPSSSRGCSDDSDDASAAVVVVYEPSAVHDQLNAIAQHALCGGAVSVGPPRKDGSATLTLPRICEWYRLDFAGGGSPLYCARKLLGFLDARVQQRVLDALDDPLATRIKFRDFTYAPKTSLRCLRVERADRGEGVDSVGDSVGDSVDEQLETLREAVAEPLHETRADETE